MRLLLKSNVVINEIVSIAPLTLLVVSKYKKKNITEFFGPVDYIFKDFKIS